MNSFIYFDHVFGFDATMRKYAPRCEFNVSTLPLACGAFIKLQDVSQKLPTK